VKKGGGVREFDVDSARRWKPFALVDRTRSMTLGRTPEHDDLFHSPRELCAALSDASIHRLLAEEGRSLFPDEAFADLFRDIGRRSVPPRIVATVMVLQRLEGLSDREAVERFTFDIRWKYACNVSLDYPAFQHTVLVDMRARLRESKSPDRIFDIVLAVAKEGGIVGRKRVLDSTALYDAVATQDTVTMIRSAIRGLLRVADAALATELRGVLRRDDDYERAGKPTCEWDDAVARDDLVDALARDAYAALALVDGRALAPDVQQAAALLATVVGQDLETTEDGAFRIARRVAKDRVISTVDPDARHGHKTAARGFDGYKGHVAIDPDSEIVTATEVTAGNVGDAGPADALLADLLDDESVDAETSAEGPAPVAETSTERPGPVAETSTERPGPDAETSAEGPAPVAETSTERPGPDAETSAERAEAYGDSSYGTADLVERLAEAGIEANMKVQAPANRDGHFTQDAFAIDTEAGQVCCPNGVLVQLRAAKDGYGHADFGAHCTECPRRDACTSSKTGRKITVHPKYETLSKERARQRDAAWKQRYRATRPKVERKIAHLMRRKHGGRRARVRGCVRVGHDFALLAAAVNLHRIAVLTAQTERAQAGA